VTITISRVEAAGPAGRARRLIFSEGSSRILPRPIARLLSLEEGAQMDPETLDGLVADVEADCAKERALQIVGARERSSSRFVTQLTGEGFDPAVIDALRARFVELGLIDDERFAAAYARTRARAGRGRRQIIHELERAGLDAEAAAVHAAQSDESDELTRAMEVLSRRPVDMVNREKCLRRLVSRGFDLSTALAALDALSQQNADRHS